VKRGAIALAVVALLLFADGSYLIARKNQVGGDTGVLFGDPHFFLSAGTVVVISSLLLILGAAVMWAVAVWRETRPAGGRGRVSQAQVSQAAASEAPAQAGAGRGQAGKGQSHQRQS
jgi:hypothetical protein